MDELPADTISIIFSVLKKYMKDINICKYGFGALYEITLNKAKSKNRFKHKTHQKIFIIDIAGVSKEEIIRLMEIMKNYIDDAIICEYGCGILRRSLTKGK